MVEEAQVLLDSMIEEKDHHRDTTIDRLLDTTTTTTVATTTLSATCTTTTRITSDLKEERQVLQDTMTGEKDHHQDILVVVDHHQDTLVVVDHHQDKTREEDIKKKEEDSKALDQPFKEAHVIDDDDGSYY